MISGLFSIHSGFISDRQYLKIVYLVQVRFSENCLYECFIE